MNELDNVDFALMVQVHFALMVQVHSGSHFIEVNLFAHASKSEPPHGKTNNLHMRKQRRRSASR